MTNRMLYWKPRLRPLAPHLWRCTGWGTCRYGGSAEDAYLNWRESQPKLDLLRYAGTYGGYGGTAKSLPWYRRVWDLLART